MANIRSILKKAAASGFISKARGDRRIKKSSDKKSTSSGRPISQTHHHTFIRESDGRMVEVTHVREVAKKGSTKIVNCLVHAASSKTATSAHTPAKLIQSLKTGLPVQELDDLRSSLGVSMERLVPMLGISKATLHRRMASGRLDPAESDRVVRFAKLMGKAVEVMESPENARLWLSAPQVGLGGAVPLEYAETEVGAREVENLLGRIEYGVFA